jgi:hypothetical protein
MARQTKRKAPLASATLFPVGTIRTGHDKHKWRIEANKNGVRRWVRIAKKTKTLKNRMDTGPLRHYGSARVLGTFQGEDAWAKLVPLRWPQTRMRATVRRRFKNVNMDHALLVIFVTPKTGAPKQIGIHFYIDKRIPGFATIDGENDNIMITEASYDALQVADAPALLRKLVADA